MSTSIRDLKPLLAFVARYDAAAAFMPLPQTAATVTTATVAA